MNGKIKDPGSAVTHFIGMSFSCAAMLPLLSKASRHGDMRYPACMAVFMICMVALYAASTIYHTFDISRRVNRILQKLDHSAISLLIAGSYTPVCLLVLEQPTGRNLCIAVWAIAAVSILIKLFWISCPKWFSSLLYIGMGWVCVFALSTIFRDLSGAAFGWLLAGGLIYTAGGIIYALKLPLFNARHKTFGSHEIFHLFVMGGSLCHYILMYAYVA